jgi:signal transduction histidine kinase
MTGNGWIIFLGVAFVTLTETTTLAQRSVSWRVYRMIDGLPESACSSLSISAQGKVLAKHINLPSASELDGYTVSIVPAPAGASRIYESPGGQFWAATSTGLQEMKEGSWVSHRLEAIANPSLNSLTRPLPLYPVRQGLVLCLVPDALVEFNSFSPEKAQTRVLRSSRQTKLEGFSSMSVGKDGGLWIAGPRGLAKVPPPLRNLKPETEWQEYIAPDSMQINELQEPHEDQIGGVAMVADCGTNHQKALLYFDGHQWISIKAGANKIRHGWRGLDGTWWAVSFNALFHSVGEHTELLETDEISARQYFDVAVEPTGAFWIATSDGLFRWAPSNWRNPGWAEKTSSVIYCLTGDQQDRVWFISGGALRFVQQERHGEYPLPKPTELEPVRGLLVLKNGTLLLEGQEHLIQFDPVTSNFRSIPMPSNAARSRILGLLNDRKVCLQVWPNSSPDSTCSLETFDGSAFQALPFPATDARIGGNFSAVLQAQNGDIWIGAEHGTACFHENKWTAFSSGDKTSPDEPVGFVELQDGRIWCATAERIWQFDGRDWSEIRRGFDRINSLVRARRDGSIWLASEGGLYRFIQGSWVENGIEEGLPGPLVRGLHEDQRGRVWAGTTRGLSLYDPDTDRDPPQTQIDDLAEKDKNIHEGGAITLTFSGHDKWKHTPRERLLYSHRLDDHDWSPFQEASPVTFADLPAGKHSFQVRAMDRNCNVDLKSAAELNFLVVLPWYKEKRLVLISMLGVLVALFFAGLAFNRHRQLVRSYAEVEKKVAERTRELEIASRELLHSQKMNALGTLAAGIAHDFNNILSIVKGSAQIIEENVENPQKVRTRVDRIKTVVEQGAGIVKAMLGFSRESNLQPATCDLNAVVEDTMKLLGDRFLREVQVSFEATNDLPAVACPKDFVQQILLNFIFNAAEATEGSQSRQITLSTRKVEQPPPGVVLAPMRSDGSIAVSVRDSGCGIQPENMGRLFEPFFTTKALSARRGTGLGLSMVYELAKKMDAGLAVETTVGRGSLFTLILPVPVSGGFDQVKKG